MIITQNNKQPLDKFQNLLFNADLDIKKEAENNPDYFLKQSALNFENDIFECLKTASKNTPFQGNIELISGHKFPDIIVNKIYGVEVKTTKQNHWKSTGNSIFETTRVNNVQNIFIYFAKLTNPINFKYRSYQECLYDIAVTHSPRYLLDMDLPEGETIFDKIGINYETFRKLKNRIEPVAEYFKKSIKTGEEPWWMSNSEQTLLDSKFTLFSTLTNTDRNKLIIKSMLIFPEIFGKSPTKYQKVATWLASRYGIVDSSLRDRFTAGGKSNIKIDNIIYKNIPRIYKNLQDNISSVIEFSNQISKTELNYYWDDFDYNMPVINQWTKKFFNYSFPVFPESKKFLIHLIGYNYPLPKPQFLQDLENNYEKKD